MRRHRTDKDEYFLDLADATSARATCRRRAVGAIAVDSDNHILSTGYNGTPSGNIHCIDNPCSGHDFNSGEGLDECRAIHAEQNMIAHCRNPKDIHIIYLTTSPCMSCMKLIVATGCRLIYASQLYDEAAKEYFNSVGGVMYIK